MPEQPQPSPEDDKNREAEGLGGEEDPNDEEDESSPLDTLANFASIMEYGDLRQLTDKITLYDALIDGREGIQRPIEAHGLPAEAVAAMRAQREVLIAAKEATERNLAIIKAALA